MIWFWLASCTTFIFASGAIDALSISIDFFKFSFCIAAKWERDITFVLLFSCFVCVIILLFWFVAKLNACHQSVLLASAYIPLSLWHICSWFVAFDLLGKCAPIFRSLFFRAYYIFVFLFLFRHCSYFEYRRWSALFPSPSLIPNINQVSCCMKKKNLCAFHVKK